MFERLGGKDFRIRSMRTCIEDEDNEWLNVSIQLLHVTCTRKLQKCLFGSTFPNMCRIFQCGPSTQILNMYLPIMNSIAQKMSRQLLLYNQITMRGQTL